MSPRQLLGSFAAVAVFVMGHICGAWHDTHPRMIGVARGGAFDLPPAEWTTYRDPMAELPAWYRFSHALDDCLDAMEPDGDGR